MLKTAVMTIHRPEQNRYRELSKEQPLDFMVKTTTLWYPELLSRIPMGLEFDEFLLSHALWFFDRQHKIQFNIAKYSLEYIKVMCSLENI